MEKRNFDEEEKERLRKKLGVDPDRLLNTVEKFMELYRKFVHTIGEFFRSSGERRKF